MNGGWIKLHRRFLKSAIWQNPNVARFWTWCLLKATHDGYSTTIGYTRVTLEPGQFLYNHPMASIETSLSQKVVRMCLEMLKSSDDPEIGQAKGRLPGNRFSIITILKWADYQDGETSEGRRGADKRASKGQAQGSLYNKEGKNVKKQRVKREAIDVIWNGEKLDVPDVFMEKYRTKYPRLDIPAIIVDVERWLLKHPAKAAGYKSFDSFLNNWLRKEAGEHRNSSSSDDDYEASPETIAIWEEFARDQKRKDAANG